MPYDTLLIPLPGVYSDFTPSKAEQFASSDRKDDQTQLQNHHTRGYDSRWECLSVCLPPSNQPKQYICLHQLAWLELHPDEHDAP